MPVTVTLYIGRDTALATEYLQLAVHALPNLATPWLLLGDTAKYRLCSFTVLSGRIYPAPAFLNSLPSLLSASLR